MSRFKQAWLSFWRKNQGLGMIETALLLPIFLMFTFAVIDFGNYLIAKQRIASANQAIASAIQNNPTISPKDLESVIIYSFGGNSYPSWSGATVSVFRTPPSVIDMTWDGESWTIRKYTNPWLLDTDPSNDNNAYYVGVRVWRGVPFLTPLPKILGLTDVLDTKNQNSDAPNGRKLTVSFTFVTLNNASCPDGQVLQSMTGGAATCVPRDRNYTCEPGQTLEKIVDGVAVCVAKDGEYICKPGQVLKEVTNKGAVCWYRDASYICGDDEVLQKADNDGTATCVKASCSGNEVLQKTQAGSAVCVNKDSAGLNCLPGNVVTGVTNGVVACGGIPAQPLPDLGNVTTKHKDTEAWSKPEKTYVCKDGYYMVGVDCDGKCNSNNMRFKCAKIQLVNP